ncbi:hypothetical protein HK100_000459 [Physocladia obscura]|uniref:Uncharacterized protein n=1 Tax=Physocladia obscura TaxID=109957 RepID=A0AAD5SZV1_9FUNG|nr:hypothetical protein HK100_000459 [Physocladia obscura]
MSFQFNSETTAAQVASVYKTSIIGKTIVITGANTGLGKEAARNFVAYGAARVIIACRNAEAGQEAATLIKSAATNTEIVVMKLDLADFSSVRAFAAAYIATGWPLHILVNNAGIMALPERVLSPEGNELQFHTNHLGHFLLTNLLAHVLISSAPARVVSVTSLGHQITGIHFDNLNFEGNYNKWQAYGQAKTANILFAIQLNKLLSTRGVEAFSVHPGIIMTNLMQHMENDEMQAFEWIDGEGKVIGNFKSIEQGAATHVFAAVSTELNGKGGAYLTDCVVTQTETKESRDPFAAEKLWKISEEKTQRNLKRRIPEDDTMPPCPDQLAIENLLAKLLEIITPIITSMMTQLLDYMEKRQEEREIKLVEKFSALIVQMENSPKPQQPQLQLTRIAAGSKETQSSHASQSRLEISSENLGSTESRIQSGLREGKARGDLGSPDCPTEAYDSQRSISPSGTTSSEAESDCAAVKPIELVKSLIKAETETNQQPSSLCWEILTYEVLTTKSHAASLKASWMYGNGSVIVDFARVLSSVSNIPGKLPMTNQQALDLFVFRRARAFAWSRSKELDTAILANLSIDIQRQIVKKSVEFSGRRDSPQYRWSYLRMSRTLRELESSLNVQIINGMNQ